MPLQKRKKATRKRVKKKILTRKKVRKKNLQKKKRRKKQRKMTRTENLYAKETTNGIQVQVVTEKLLVSQFLG